jgi:plastocyanin
MTRSARVVLTAAAFTIVSAGGYVVDAGASGSGAAVLGPGLATVTIDIEHSEFSVDELRVRPGTTVEFVVRNGDPINHEFVTGDDDVHRRHESGSERRHPPVPGEVSVGPHATGVTFFEFDDPGAYLYACHLPGHVAYGMTGEIVVEA